MKVTLDLYWMVQKFYAIKSEAAISKGTIISTFFALVVSTAPAASRPSP